MSEMLIDSIVNGQLEKTTTTANESSKKSAVAGGELGKDAFLQLLVTQMQNQDPLEPTANTEYVTQLATYTQVETLQNISTSMENMQALSMVGKYVDIYYTSSAGTEVSASGYVDSVTVKEGSAYVIVDGSSYAYDKVTQVYDKDPNEKSKVEGTTEA